ncbi:MAG: MinD/ParA family protein [Candidatus Eisenbacteria bacterium]|uniref:MinD/ParA family protein n=1 Tax=Eiseniibacteriota bacterium TaxID=2212470 RepID=A0A538TRD7_UNCEI|nr:MAG: MinD/ParA family protein [Candidatus Eisenbacteria bacterium]
MARRGSVTRPPAGGETPPPAAARPLTLVSAPARGPDAEETDHPVRWSRPRVPMLAVASGKGGVGKSNLAVNLAVALGHKGVRVLLVDADLAQANLDLLLGVHPRFDLQHVLSGQKTVEEIIVEGPPGVKLVPACSGAPELAELDDYRREVLLRALGHLDMAADLILMDVASGVSHQVISLCRAADRVVVVTTPETPAFCDAYALIKVLWQRGLQAAPHLVVNFADTPEEAEETAHRIRLVARRFLKVDVDVWGHVPFDHSIPRAVRLQEPVMTAFPTSPAAAAYRALAERAWTGPLSPPEASAPLISETLEA